MTKEEHFEKAMELFVDDKLEEAAAEFELALEIDPAYGDALHAAAMSYYHMDQLDKALEYGKKFLAAEPNNVHAYTSLSMFYNAKGFIEKAEEMGAMASKLASSEGST